MGHQEQVKLIRLGCRPQFFDDWKAEHAAKSNLNHADHIELVQFHPSYSYEDFIEGLRPIIDEDGTSHLVLINGIFKEFCRNAGKWEVDVFKQNKNLDWNTITIDNIFPYKDALTGHHWESIFSHQDTSTLVSEAVPPFFFIIDEINRAELSRVFGELMYCLEYRGIRGSVKTQYANLNNEKTGMLKNAKGYEFFIPSNAYLMGTMNTIDRSIESFDFALRRRFRWEEVNPNIQLLKYHLEDYCSSWVVLAENLEKLNSKIAAEPLLGHEYQVGHAYLMNLNYDRNLSVTKVRKFIWDDCIGPLIQEYLRGSGNEGEIYQSFMRDFGV